ncbi:MAG: adenylate/guanylate cyclase domain-containing protein [Gammaproteobacteria bacterium]|nr:adenylate/guanylate cyclase domain-containing protein [Gammaproteobacteria bacterium]
MAQKKSLNLATMFADISGSTSLYEKLGDQKARSTVASCMMAAARIIHGEKGKVIKTIGDELMCVFRRADEAVSAAAKLHETLEDQKFEGTELSMRIGIHYGPGIVEGSDVFGDAVNTAARMVAQAKAKQTIISKDSVDLLPAYLRDACRFVDTASLKGKKEDMQIYEALWQQEDSTRMVMPVAKKQAAQGAATTLIIRYHDKTVKLDKRRSSLLMGRSEGCDLYVDEQLASRYHVRIELRRDKFFIIDQSTNGTYLRLNGGGEDTFLRREEMPLTGSGQISLGRTFDDNPTEIVVFSHGK